MTASITCDDARGDLPRYLDDELTERQAAPLRAHLLSCQRCRATVQDGKALRSWFVATPAVDVPGGFAARVARRARAGDRGTLVPVPASAQASPASAQASPASAQTSPASAQTSGSGDLVFAGPGSLATSPESEERLRSFLVTAVALAALLLLTFSIAMRRLDVPGGVKSLDATTDSLERSVEALREMNEGEADGAEPGEAVGEEEPR